MADLFEIVDLANKLQADLDTASAEEARRTAQSWLASATLLTEWPTPIPENLRTWALELAGLVYDNPAWLTTEHVGGTITTWALERRAEILAEARTVYGVGVLAGHPTGSFPDPECWPDPFLTTYGYRTTWTIA
jgi:hypothetical protein